MNSLVVLFCVLSAACASLVPLAQPAHLPALLLDPLGRPLDTAEVQYARALHLQAKALEGHYAPYAPALLPAVSHQALLPYAHYLHKRSLGHYAYAAPALIAAPAAVSHQSRVDVRSSPALVSHAVAAPVLAHAAPVLAVAPSAVSHQSRVDVRTSPAVVAHAAIAPVAVAHAAPVYSAYSSLAAPFYGAHGYSYGGHGFSHFLKKRSLGHIVAPVVHTLPSAVSHQSRVDVISKPAVVTSHIAPAVYSAPAIYSAPAVYAAPALSHISPIAHSAIWSTPYLGAAHW